MRFTRLRRSGSWSACRRASAVDVGMLQATHIGDRPWVCFFVPTNSTMPRCDEVAHVGVAASIPRGLVQVDEVDPLRCPNEAAHLRVPGLVWCPNGRPRPAAADGDEWIDGSVGWWTRHGTPSGDRTSRDGDFVVVAPLARPRHSSRAHKGRPQPRWCSWTRWSGPWDVRVHLVVVRFAWQGALGPRGDPRPSRRWSRRLCRRRGVRGPPPGREQPVTSRARAGAAAVEEQAPGLS